MEEPKTITIGANEYTLRQWPALPGFRFTRVILRAGADFYDGITLKIADIKKALAGADTDSDFKLNPAMIDKVLSDKNMDEIVAMITEGLNGADGKELDEKQRKALRIDVLKFTFPDFVMALIEVLKHNLVFLMGHLTPLFQNLSQSAISTQPALASRGSAESPSTPS